MNDILDTHTEGDEIREAVFDVPSQEAEMVAQRPLWTYYILPLSILVAAVMISGSVLYTRGGQTNIAQESPTEEVLGSANIDISPDDHILGDPNAPVAIVEFSDFQCPFCRSFWTGAYQQLKTDYIDTGKAFLVYKHLPLSFHPAAGFSAQATECAEEQGKFWELHDEIFARQAATGSLGTVEYTRDMLLQWADEIGIDTAALTACMDAGTYDQRIGADMTLANSVGVSGTPTFFINGERLIGAQPYEIFQQVIDSQL